MGHPLMTNVEIVCTVGVIPATITLYQITGHKEIVVGSARSYSRGPRGYVEVPLPIDYVFQHKLREDEIPNSIIYKYLNNSV